MVAESEKPLLYIYQLLSFRKSFKDVFREVFLSFRGSRGIDTRKEGRESYVSKQ